MGHDNDHITEKGGGGGGSGEEGGRGGTIEVWMSRRSRKRGGDKDLYR